MIVRSRSIVGVRLRLLLFERDNVRVHRAVAKKLTIKKPRDPRLRVQRIVIHGFEFVSVLFLLEG